MCSSFQGGEISNFSMLVDLQTWCELMWVSEISKIIQWIIQTWTHKKTELKFELCCQLWTRQVKKYTHPVPSWHRNVPLVMPFCTYSWDLMSTNTSYLFMRLKMFLFIYHSTHISCRTWHVWPCFSCPSIIPVGDDAMLNGILQSQHSTSTLSIVSNVGVLRIHADDHCAHPWGHVHQTGKFVGNPTWLAGKSTVGREKTLWMWGSLFPGKKLEGILKLDMEVGIPSLWDVLVSNVYLPNLACRTLLSMGSIPMHLGAVPIRPKSTCIPIFPKLLDAFQLLL